VKHSAKITIILLLTFLIAQFVGIGILYNYIDPVKSLETGETEFKNLPIGERPPIEESTSYLPIILAVLLGTGIVLILIKFKMFMIWKIWFLLAVFMTLLVAFNAFVPVKIALALALIFSFWKIFKPNFWVHTGTELFVYGGLAAIFAPVFSVLSVSILLVLISIYDAYAVWKSKHMITLAKSQAKANVFAGLMIPYTEKGIVHKKSKKRRKKKGVQKVIVKTAILGGGDIGFPLLFAGAILKDMGLWQALIIPFFAAAGLGYLFLKSKEKKFYPAMPFISVGCFVGLGVIWLIGLI